MENQKVVDLLRSVANLIETKEDDNAKEIMLEIVGDRASLDKINSDTSVQRSLSIMKRIEDSDKVRSYKTKISNQDTKMKDYLNKIDELRMEAIIGLHDVSIQSENHNTEENVNS